MSGALRRPKPRTARPSVTRREAEQPALPAVPAYSQRNVKSISFCLSLRP
jgi:hypothetical protein